MAQILTRNTQLTRQFRQELPLSGADSPSVATYRSLLMPSAIHARLSAHCNLSCGFCERESWKTGDKEAEQDMTDEVWDRLRDVYLPHVKGAELVGLGEPTLARLFPRAARDVVASGKILYFATNGLFLDKRHVLDSVGDSPRVSISVDAGDAESYSLVRGGDWQRLKDAVATFRLEKPGAYLHSQFTAGKYNIDYFPAFVEAASDWGINEVLFRWVQAHTVAREDVSLRWSKDRTEAALTAAWEISLRTGITLVVERRPYSDTDPNLDGWGLLDGSPHPKIADMAAEADTGPTAPVDTPAFSPGMPAANVPSVSSLSRLRKYLDFMPMDSPTCGASITTTTAFDGDGGDGGDGGGDIDPDSFGDPEIFDRNMNEIFRVGPAGSSAGGGAGSGSASASQPRDYSEAALISTWDGVLWSCFAQHVVGNALTDDFETVIRNPRYQAFLQNRSRGNPGVLEEKWCANCARVF